MEFNVAVSLGDILTLTSILAVFFRIHYIFVEMRIKVDTLWDEYRKEKHGIVKAGEF
jgi:hypothetical protein